MSDVTIFTQSMSGVNMQSCAEESCDEKTTEEVTCVAVVPYSTDTPSDQLSWTADKPWCVRLLRVCTEGVRQRYLSAWFSTLGGAHSALGDTLGQHAKKAGLVSKQQLALAMMMGDPLFVSRCNLFVAFSLLQQGKVKKAARIIREQYRYATQESPIYDKKLVDMCLAAWGRVQELKHSIPNLTDSPTLTCGAQLPDQSI